MPKHIFASSDAADLNINSVVLESASEDLIDHQSDVRNEEPIESMPYENSVQDQQGVFNVHYGLQAMNMRISRSNNSN